MKQKVKSAAVIMREMRQLQSRLDKILMEKDSRGNVYDLSWLQENEIRGKILKCRNAIRKIGGAV